MLDDKHSLDDVPTPSLTLASDESGTLTDPSKCLAEVLGSANEGCVEGGLVDVVLRVARGRRCEKKRVQKQEQNRSIGSVTAKITRARSAE